MGVRSNTSKFVVRVEYHAQYQYKLPLDNGVFYTGKFELLGVQILSTLFVIAFTAILTFLFLKLLSKFEPLRAKPFEEDVGLDFSEHGVNAIEVARTKLIQSIIYNCDTLENEDVKNTLRKFLIGIDIDVDQFSHNWQIFKSMFHSHHQKEIQNAEIEMAALLDFRDDDQKAAYVRKQTENLNQILSGSDEEHSRSFSDSRKIFVKALAQILTGSLVSSEKTVVFICLPRVLS